MSFWYLLFTSVLRCWGLLARLGPGQHRLPTNSRHGDGKHACDVQTRQALSQPAWASEGILPGGQQ